MILQNLRLQRLSRPWTFHLGVRIYRRHPLSLDRVSRLLDLPLPIPRMMEEKEHLKQ